MEKAEKENNINESDFSENEILDLNQIWIKNKHQSY